MASTEDDQKSGDGTGEHGGWAQVPVPFDARGLDAMTDAERGLIEAGEVQEGAKVRRVRFKPDTTPAVSVTILYHKR